MRLAERFRPAGADLRRHARRPSRRGRRGARPSGSHRPRHRGMPIARGADRRHRRGRGRFGRGDRPGGRRPHPDARAFDLLGDLARGLRRDPVAQRRPGAGGGRSPAPDRPGPAAAAAGRPGDPGAAGWCAPWPGHHRRQRRRRGRGAAAAAAAVVRSPSSSAPGATSSCGWGRRSRPSRSPRPDLAAAADGRHGCRQRRYSAGSSARTDRPSIGRRIRGSRTSPRSGCPPLASTASRPLPMLA